MIPESQMCQVFIKKVKKQEARKFVGISRNSNRQLPCEINCELLLTNLMKIEITLFLTSDWLRAEIPLLGFMKLVNNTNF